MHKIVVAKEKQFVFTKTTEVFEKRIALKLQIIARFIQISPLERTLVISNIFQALILKYISYYSQLE